MVIAGGLLYLCTLYALDYLTVIYHSHLCGAARGDILVDHRAAKVEVEGLVGWDSLEIQIAKSYSRLVVSVLWCKVISGVEVLIGGFAACHHHV